MAMSMLLLSILCVIEMTRCQVTNNVDIGFSPELSHSPAQYPVVYPQYPTDLSSLLPGEVDRTGEVVDTAVSVGFLVTAFFSAVFLGQLAAPVVYQGFRSISSIGFLPRIVRKDDNYYNQSNNS